MRDSGFTLLEVLVAFVIAALAVGALLQGAGTGLAAARIAGHYQEAVSRAQSRLAALSIAPVPGEQSGTEAGGFAWRSTVQPVAVTPRPNANGTNAGSTNANSTGNPKRVALLALSVVVSWTTDGGRREVALSTQRLGEAPPEPP